jgi:hypothetical protein
MIREDQVFVVDVVITDLMQKTVVLSVINQLACAIAKLSDIAKIYKYIGLCEGHHFISMAMEVHNSLGHDMDRFIKECVCLFHDRVIYPCLFAFNFSNNMLIFFLTCFFAFVIEKKITLAGDACSKPPIKSHDLHVGNIKGAVGEIASYHNRY